VTVLLITPAEAARDYQRRLSYIYKLATVHGWRRLTYAGRVYYHLADVDAVLGRD
jgi:ABC-type Mn2+/Zn2+ transport system permease subunit